LFRVRSRYWKVADEIANGLVLRHSKERKDKVIEKIICDGKTYFNITNYESFHDLFGQLLLEVQRIKSEWGYNGGKVSVDKYGKVDQKLHPEVLG
jgi:dipeptidyl-peptidase-3